MVVQLHLQHWNKNELATLCGMKPKQLCISSAHRSSVDSFLDFQVNREAMNKVLKDAILMAQNNYKQFTYLKSKRSLSILVIMYTLNSNLTSNSQYLWGGILNYHISIMDLIWFCKKLGLSLINFNCHQEVWSILFSMWVYLKRRYSLITKSLLTCLHSGQRDISWFFLLKYSSGEWSSGIMQLFI